MKNSLATRIWFACMGAMLWVGIYFTGFSAVSWVLYLPAAGLTLASIIGFCPIQKVFFKLFPDR